MEREEHWPILPVERYLVGVLALLEAPADLQLPARADEMDGPKVAALLPDIRRLTVNLLRPKVAHERRPDIGCLLRLPVFSAAVVR